MVIKFSFFFGWTITLGTRTQFVAVGEKDGCAVENMRQSSLDQFPSRDALDGFSEGWRKTMEFVLHKHPLK